MPKLNLQQYKDLAGTTLTNFKGKVTTNIKNNNVLKWILIIVTIFVAAYAADHIHWKHQATPYELAMQEWTAQSKKLIHERDSIASKVKFLEQKSAEDSVKAVTSTKQINSLREKVAVKESQLNKRLTEAKATLPDTCKTAIAIAEGYKSNVDSLSVALVKADQRDSLRQEQISLAVRQKELFKTEADSLTALVARVPVAKPEKFLGFIPLPSRKTSFVAGLAAGTVATVVTIAATH